MGNGKICDCCLEFTSLLQSYDTKRGPLTCIDDINISREEIETVILYMQSWTQRQCSCCFRDSKNFERYNWALQVLILVSVEILRHYHDKPAKRTSSAEAMDTLLDSGKDETVNVPIVEEIDLDQQPKPLWDIDEKEKLIHFVSKVFQSSFQTYIAYKQHIQMRAEEVSQQEIQSFGLFCELNEPDVSPYLYRNVTLFCKNGGLVALQQFIKNQTPDSLPLHLANMIVGLATTVKAWLNFPALLNFFVPFRSSVLSYLNKLVDTELKTTSARNMNEYIWTAVKDPIDAHLSFDRDGLDLAFKYFLSSTLTMRLSGVTQITNHINLLNELLNSDSILDSDSLDHQLNLWLIENQIMEHMFGPNLHVEVIKQSNTLLTYLAIEGKISKDHIDIMWAAAQLKHCSRTVYDVLSLLIGNFEPHLILHLRDLLLKLEPKDHTEASLFLTSNLTKFMWNNAAVSVESPVGTTPIKYGQRLRQMSNLVESSSENSVSIGGSPSEDEIQPLQLPRVLDTCNMVPRLVGDDSGVTSAKLRVGNRMSQSRLIQLARVVAEDSSDDDSVEISGGDSGKSEDQENQQVSSSGYVESHSDSDADAEKSGNEETTNKGRRRRVLRRRKSKSKSLEGSVDNNVGGGTKVGSPIMAGNLSSGEPLDVSVGDMVNVSSDKENDSSQAAKMDLSSGSGSVPDLLEPNAVMHELSNLVQMTDTPMIQEIVPNLHVNSDAGSYSSRMSTKSEKNMADFDGEESICEDEIMQSLSQKQITELAVGESIRLTGLGPVFGPRPVRPFNRRRRALSSNGFNFQIDDVCSPGQTILWDLIQDDKITQLPDGLALEVQKALSTLLCYNSDKRIKYKFIEGCIQNITENKSIVISLRLLPKLLSCYPQPRTAETYQMTIWVDREFQMRDKFFENLKIFKQHDTVWFPFPYQAHLQVRFEFLSVLFASMTSPEDFRLSIEHLDVLWDCLATDQRSADDLFIWMSGQVRIREQHALSAAALRHIFIKKLPSLPPETVTMHALNLFQQLCSIARSSGEQDIEAAAASMDYLWKIALCALRTDVSMAAIQYLNGYYISRQLEKEDEFIQRCMSHLAEATEDLTHCTPSDEAPLLRIQRALLLLKTHLETFRRRYAYHLRKWYLEGSWVGSHAQLVGEKGAVPIKVSLQAAGWLEKATLELQSTDYVADLRAEVVKWWESLQGNAATEKNTATPVLGSLLTEGPIRMITNGIELSAEYDEKCISEVPIKDMQLVYVSPGAGRSHKKKDSLEYSSSLLPPPRDKLPVTLLLQMRYFEQLFSLTQSLAALKTSDRSGESQPHTKGQVLSRRVWDILMLLPTNPSIHEGIANSMQTEENSFRTLLDPASPQKLMYSLYIVEALVKNSPAKIKDQPGTSSSGNESVAWRQHFVERGGLRHLFDIFSSGVLESMEGGDWSEWKQDCLASLLKILCFLGIMSEDTDFLNEQLYDVNDVSRKKTKRRKVSNDKSPIPRLNETMLAMMDVGQVMTRLTNIFQACSLPRDPNHYKTGFWGRAQVVHYAMALLVCWAFSRDDVKTALYSQKDFAHWLRRLVLEDPEPAVRREVCTGLYRLCLGISSDGKTGTCYAPELISHLLQCLKASLTIKPQQKQEVQVQNYEEGKEPYGPACRDYFWLLGRLLDCLEEDFIKESIENPDSCVIDLDGLARTLSKAIMSREYYETRHNTVTDDALVGLLTTCTVVMKHNPPFKTLKEGQDFLKQIFDCLFALPSPQMRYLPKCKSLPCRSAAFDLLTELTRHAVQNYYLLQNLLIGQHQPISHSPYGWDYWPHEDGRSSCGYVGLTNLGATCYMASCMQHLYMMPQARASILGAKCYSQSKHEQTLRELQRMFAYLMESERKAYNPRSFCKVYQMDHQPLNTGEQKDMAEFFIDLVSKLEEMTPELQKLIKTLFCGVTSNNVVSLDCPHVSRTLEEFYTVRCQVSDMRTLYDSLNEVTVKDTLEGDNMYTCSQCGKKVRAEKRACFKKLPKILAFNTMRYTFNMITMMKEKVNTHFSFPLHLDMSGYVEKTLMPQQYQEEKLKKMASKKEGEEEGNSGAETETEEDECLEYDLIGVTVHTGTADGGHYYSFIRDRVPPNKDKWYLFNDAEVKPFDPNQIASECFGGEMSTKTYDSVTDKFMDFSFEKTNSAYMLFYERRTASAQLVPGEGQLVPSLPGGSSQRQHQSQIVPTQTLELNKELEDWIWQDNTHFLRDKNIFEHTYFNFMWQVCGYIPQSLVAQEDVSLLAAKLSVTFFLETFIHAKEKPTMVQWVEHLTKQLSASQSAAAWFLDHMGETDWWPVQILLKCSNQIVRQMFQRLCIHDVQQVSRARHVSLLYPKPFVDQPGDPDALTIAEYTNYSCVTRFIKRLLSLLEHGAKSYLKNLTEYFTLLHDFSKLGDEECLFLINMEAITVMVNFYLGKKEDPVEHGSEEEEEEEEVVCIPAEKNKVASLEKMIALVAILVEKSRDEMNHLKLSPSDVNSLTGNVKGPGDQRFQFILQQIRDGINLQSTRNMIFSLCRWNEPLARDIVGAIIFAIRKHPEICNPFFKVLSLLAELGGMPPGMPPFTDLILAKILDVTEMCAYPTLEWLASQVPRNKTVQTWCLETMVTWTEHFLINHSQQRVRNGAASLLVSLVPNQPFRQGFRGTKMYTAHHCRETFSLSPDAINTLHVIYLRLLNLLKPAKHYTDPVTHGTTKLTCYFAVLTYFTISKTERQMAGQYFLDLWNLFHPKLSEPAISCHHNKQALLLFWHHILLDCPENVQRILQNPVIKTHIAFNYILADHDEQEVVMFNRTMLPAYYAILRICCQASRQFSSQLARHQNMSWAFKNISPFPTQYPAAVEELLKLMKIFVSRPNDATEQEIDEIAVFKRNTLQLYLSVLDGRSNWTTLISAFRILVETFEDRLYVVAHNGLNLLFDALHMLHTMHHEATACHVTGEIVDLLNLITGILHSFRIREAPLAVPIYGSSEVVQIHKIIGSTKEWPEVLRKLATFLNTYNNADLRAASIETMTEFLYLMPVDTLRTLVPLMIHCHSAYQDVQNTGMGPTLGPNFPKRSHHGHGVTIKPSVRPPRPMLQMAIPHLNRDTSRGYKGSDEDYDQQLREFYAPYHVFVDLMCRFAFLKDFITQELITLSAMVGYEGAPLRMLHFPKLWTEVRKSQSIDRKYLQILVSTTYFTDYVELILNQERLSLHHEVINKFLKHFLPMVYEKIVILPSIAKTAAIITSELRNVATKQIPNLEELALRIMADLKALALLYTPAPGKPVLKNPLPAPAPSTPQVSAVLQLLHAHVKSCASNKLREHKGEKGESPPKKRRLNEEGEDIASEVGCSASGVGIISEADELLGRTSCQLKLGIEYNIISAILGTISTLCKKLGSVVPEPENEPEVVPITAAQSLPPSTKPDLASSGTGTVEMASDQSGIVPESKPETEESAKEEIGDPLS